MEIASNIIPNILRRIIIPFCPKTRSKKRVSRKTMYTTTMFKTKAITMFDTSYSALNESNVVIDLHRQLEGKAKGTIEALPDA